jgi:hypothetical protein
MEFSEFIRLIGDQMVDWGFQLNRQASTYHYMKRDRGFEYSVFIEPRDGLEAVSWVTTSSSAGSVQPRSGSNTPDQGVQPVSLRGLGYILHYVSKNFNLK